MQDIEAPIRFQESKHSHVEPRWPYSGRGHRDPQLGSPAVQIAGLQVHYPGAPNPAIANASLQIDCGQRAAIVGHNGAGKSTLLKAMAGLLKPRTGTIRLFGNPVGACHHQTAYLPQRSDLDWQFPVSVRQLVLTGRYVHLGWFRKPRKHDKECVNLALRRLGIEQLKNRPIGDLSGGQQQRALLARALVQEASLFLFDEPLNGLDEATRDTVDDVLCEHTDRGGTVLVATHDLGRLSESFDRVIYLSEAHVKQVEDLHSRRMNTPKHSACNFRDET